MVRQWIVSGSSRKWNAGCLKFSETLWAICTVGCLCFSVGWQLLSLIFHHQAINENIWRQTGKWDQRVSNICNPFPKVLHKDLSVAGGGGEGVCKNLWAFLEEKAFKKFRAHFSEGLGIHRTFPVIMFCQEQELKTQKSK
jgi:hypothetical protein